MKTTKGGVKRYGVVSQIYRNHKYDFDDKLMLTATVPVELRADGSISNQITQEIYQFSFEFFSNVSPVPNNSNVYHSPTPPLPYSPAMQKCRKIFEKLYYCTGIILAFKPLFCKVINSRSASIRVRKAPACITEFPLILVEKASGTSDRNLYC